MVSFGVSILLTLATAARQDRKSGARLDKSLADPTKRGGATLRIK